MDNRIYFSGRDTRSSGVSVMITRLVFVKGIVAACFVPKQKKVVVSTLEHLPETKYVDRREFDSLEEAVEFVRSLQVHVKSIGPKPTDYESWIQHAKTGEIVARTWCRFIDADEAWAYLENMRVDGKPVTRPRSGKLLNEYVIKPLIVDGSPLYKGQS